MPCKRGGPRLQVYINWVIYKRFWNSLLAYRSDDHDDDLSDDLDLDERWQTVAFVGGGLVRTPYSMRLTPSMSTALRLWVEAGNEGVK